MILSPYALADRNFASEGRHCTPVRSVCKEGERTPPAIPSGRVVIVAVLHLPPLNLRICSPRESYEEGGYHF